MREGKGGPSVLFHLRVPVLPARPEISGDTDSLQIPGYPRRTFEHAATQDSPIIIHLRKELLENDLRNSTAYRHGSVRINWKLESIKKKILLFEGKTPKALPS